MFEIAILQNRHFQRHVEQGDRRDQFNERRMLGVEPEVRVLPGHVSGIDVVVFIPSDGIAVRGEG